jgi:hypothetical protein
MFLGLEFNLSTLVVAALIVAWAVWAIRRLRRNGMCDCHADDPQGGSCGCSGGCGGCHGCGAAANMVADMSKAAKR